MQRTRQTIARATRRLVLLGWIRTLAVTLALALAAVLVVRVVEKLGPPMDLPWNGIALGGAGFAVLGSFLWAVVRRPNALGVARTVDARAGLSESLSTALHVGDSKDGWARMVVETAERRAALVDVNRSLPIEFGKRWATPAILALGVLGVWWLPGYDLTGRQQAAAEEQRQRDEVRTVAAEVRAQQNELKTALERAGIDLEGLETDDPFNAIEESARTPDDVRRAALRQLTEVTNELSRAQEGERGQEMQAVRDAMRQLQSPGDGPMADLARSLARGNFQDAQKQVQELQRQLSQNEMNPQERQAAQQALSQMSRQLQNLSQDRSALASAMQAAGMSPEQAERAMQNPQNLEQALNQMQNLTPEQREQLQQMAQGMQNAGQTMSNMASAMDQMAQQMQGQQGQQSGQSGEGAAQDLAQQLSQMEMLQNEMQSMQQAMQQAQQQMQQLGQGMCENPGGNPGNNPFGGQPGQGGQGMWAEGSSTQRGQGSGAAGRGTGDGTMDPQEADFTLNREQDQVANRGGPIIGSTVVYGGQVRGEARQTYRAAVGAASASATEAIETMSVPPEYHAAVKHYFGRLDEQGNAEPAPQPTTPPVPASDAGGE